MDLKELRNKTTQELRDLSKSLKKDVTTAAQAILQNKEKSFKNKRSLKLQIARVQTVLREKEFISTQPMVAAEETKSVKETTNE